MNTVHVMIGAPGSGKTTLAKTLVGGDWNTVSTDEFFVDKKTGEYMFDATKLSEAHAWCLRRFVRRAQGLVSQPAAPTERVVPYTPRRDDIVVDNTNSSIAEIAPYYALANAYGYNVVFHFFVGDVDVYLRRQTHGVPVGVVFGIHRRVLELVTAFAFPPFWQFEKKEHY